MQTYKIHLIRHGMTDANERGLYIGRTDLPLSPAGVSDLLKKKEAFVYPYAERCFVAPLLRCRQTAEVLYPGVNAETVEDLTECDFGEWDGKSLSELKTRQDFADWIAGKRTEIPGGESAQAFQTRVTAAFEHLVETVLRERITESAVITHGGVIMMLMAAYALPRQEMSVWAADNGCGFTLRVTPMLWMREPVAEAVSLIPWNRTDEDEEDEKEI